MITLITGGARSGKSRFAESKYSDKEDVVYIATSRVLDKEMQARVDHHREMRPSHWRTYEGNYNLSQALGAEKHYLLDCVTVLTSNIMFDITKDEEYIDQDLQRQVEDKVMEELGSLINSINSRGYELILVTNEVGLSIVPENHISRVFRDIQGRINQRIAALSHEVYLVCCGIPVKIK
ncbi:MAG: bifunctional adenosylcobinamide kinase/adenosylcobinamide-phosphate guanylyltransferase [Tissierellaceae bacterium]|jgi:adenosylcobinamide kinase/adenosylcobinamide-phosphate guanylyltransferase|nr:bifunctional adenosylcobinamide kinase/adenosylcobinamide-phosphate guanylyltransferase [Tissierellia bacterium]